MADDFRFALLAVWIVLALLHSLTAARQDPRVIALKDIPHYLLGGAKLRYVIDDLSNCETTVVNDTFTFAGELKSGFLDSNDWYALFSHEQKVDGSWKGLPGPADNSMFAMLMADKSVFIFTDLDPRNDHVLATVGFIACGNGSVGGSVIAVSDVGTPLSGLTELTTALTSGYRVSYSVDLGQCQENGKAPTSIDNEHAIYFGVIDNFRFHHDELATNTFLLNTENRERSWLHMKFLPNNTAAVKFISLSTKHRVQTVRSFTCTVGVGRNVLLYQLSQ